MQALLFIAFFLFCPPAYSIGRQTLINVFVEGDTQSIAENRYASDWPTYKGELEKLWTDMHEAACRMGAGAILHTGDVVEHHAVAREWDRADAAFNVLDSCGIPYYVPPGNHDFQQEPLDMSSWVKWSAKRTWSYSARYVSSGLERAWFGKLWSNWNVAVLSYGATRFETQWVTAQAKLYPDDFLIVLGHEIISSGGRVVPTYVRELVRTTPNVRLLVGGHWLIDPRVDLSLATGASGEVLHGLGLFSNFQGPVCISSQTGCTLGKFFATLGVPNGYLHGWVTQLTLFESGKVCAAPTNLLARKAKWNVAPECLE